MGECKIKQIGRLKRSAQQEEMVREVKGFDKSMKDCSANSSREAYEFPRFSQIEAGLQATAVQGLTLYEKQA